MFPDRPGADITRGPLSLTRCSSCGLVQLLHSYDRDELYGETYGYRSSLNRMMVEHLQRKAASLATRVRLEPGDVVLDIGSNDATFLASFEGRGATLVGFDPSAVKWKDRYPQRSLLVTDFFTSDAYRSHLGDRKAKLVTSIAMFYDLEDPVEFVEHVRDVLADDGIWHLEQSYLPTMMAMNAYDTVCHEHLEYYALEQIKAIADRAGLVVIDVELNDVNGGSFAVTLAKRGGPFSEDSEAVARRLESESELRLSSLQPFDEFRARVFAHRDELRSLLEELRAAGSKVLGYGASTKGNVLLQFTGIDASLLPAIAEVNEDKFGCFTPGTSIPIIPEDEARARKPDYLLVMPWHFRDGIVRREAAFLRDGGRLIFPLPKVEVVSA